MYCTSLSLYVFSSIHRIVAAACIYPFIGCLPLSRSNANTIRRIITDGLGFTGNSYGNRRTYGKDDWLASWIKQQQQTHLVNSSPIYPNLSSSLPTNPPSQPIRLQSELPIGEMGLLVEENVSDLENPLRVEEKQTARKQIAEEHQRLRRYQQQLRRDKITAQNTINNSAVDQTATTVFLTNNNSQWVLNNRSVDHMKQLQQLNQYQKQLQQSINQQQHPTPKRSINQQQH